MTTTIHAIHNRSALAAYMLENDTNSKWLIFNGKDTKQYKTIDAWAHGHMKKISTDMMQTENGIFYSISRDAYVSFKFVDIFMEKYFESLKNGSLTVPIKEELCKLFCNTDMIFIVSEWMTPETRDSCVNKHIISEGFNVPNNAIDYSK